MTTTKNKKRNNKKNASYVSPRRRNNANLNRRARRVSAYNMYNYLYGGAGGGYSGAGDNRVTRHWTYSGGAADSETLADIQTLRERSRDLYRNNAIGRGAICTLSNNVIASGLRPT